MRTDQEIEEAIKALADRRVYAVEKQAIPQTQILQILFDGMVEELDIMLAVLRGRMSTEAVYKKYPYNGDKEDFLSATLALEYMRGDIHFDKIIKPYLWQ